MSAQRIQKSATIRLDAAIDIVFPLFGPIREKDWADGWNPEVIYPKDTLVAKQMVFRTQGGLHGSTEAYTWVIVNYEPDDFMIEYMVSAFERFWFITVNCRAADQHTLATITYSYTSLSDQGSQRNEKALNDIFSSNLLDWEDAINSYIHKPKPLIYARS